MFSDRDNGSEGGRDRQASEGGRDEALRQRHRHRQGGDKGRHTDTPTEHARKTETET